MIAWTRAASMPVSAVLTAMPNTSLCFLIQPVVSAQCATDRDWAEMIRKVYEVNLIACPRCQAEMCIITLPTDFSIVGRIINRLKLTFGAERVSESYYRVINLMQNGGRPLRRFNISP